MLRFLSCNVTHCTGMCHLATFTSPCGKWAWGPAKMRTLCLRLWMLVRHCSLPLTPGSHVSCQNPGSPGRLTCSCAGLSPSVLGLNLSKSSEWCYFDMSQTTLRENVRIPRTSPAALQSLPRHIPGPPSSHSQTCFPGPLAHGVLPAPQSSSRRLDLSRVALRLGPCSANTHRIWCPYHLSLFHTPDTTTHIPVWQQKYQESLQEGSLWGVGAGVTKKGEI